MPSDTRPMVVSPTGDLPPFGDVRIPRTEISRPQREAVGLHRQVRELEPRTRRLRQQELSSELEQRQKAMARRSAAELLDILSETGLAWRDIARLVGVSVPAVQKWRRGAGVTGENTGRIAKVAALLECLGEDMITEPASWLEIPLTDEAPVRPLDMLIAGRYDLVLEVANDAYVPDVTPAKILDEFDPDWRTKYVDDGFETFRGEDGVLSIQPRA